MNKKHGYIVISLDFELFWGMCDVATIESYGAKIRGERTAVPRILALFSKYNIHATWGLVGMSMARNKTELYTLLPPSELRPQYTNTEVSSYTHLETSIITETDPHYFGHDLITKILETRFQEIGNHTFSHYYCLEPQHNKHKALEADFDAHAKITETYGITTTSLIFPRNQYDTESLEIAKEKGMTAYRGNENHILYRTGSIPGQSLLLRGFRLLDHYINLSGNHTYSLPHKEARTPINIPASRFFRPWNPLFRIFEPLRLRRIKNAMTHAAKKGGIFHLWWHPHNFGTDQEQNCKNLEAILKHYTFLKERYDMESASMQDIVKYVDESVVSTTLGA